MADSESVKRALERLAGGEPLADWHRASVIDEGATAATDIEAAACFMADGGVDRLEQAIAAAERTGDHSLTRRGQRVLAAFQWFQRAAATWPDDGPSKESNYFHCARTTPLGGRGKRADT